jgi:predicted ribosome quality control (RQC) complex YloA/Tae2 family protein
MNGIYLHLLLREISEDLLGAFVQDIRIEERIVQIMLNERSLYISLYPTVLGMFLVKSSDRSYEPLSTMSEMAKSCRIIGIVQENFVPVMKMILEKPFPRKEVLEIFASFYPEAPNFSMRTELWQRNIFPRYIEKKPKSSILHLREEEMTHAGVDYIIKNIEGVDKKMAEEMNMENLLLIKSAIQGAKIHPKLVSVDPLHISLSGDDDGEEFPGLNELFKAAITRFEGEHEKKRSEQVRRLLLKNLKRRITRLKKKLLQPEEIEYCRTAGELILSNIARIKKGHVAVDLFDPYTQERREIILDPRLSPQANAQRYFARYKKDKRGQPKLKEQITGLEKEMMALESRPQVKVVKKKAASKTGPASEPFHKFTLESGSVVFVGKNARSNDQLTFGHARPGDYFFHARGVEGAHAILRPNIPRGQRPGKDEIRMTGAIAAYFSKARKQHNVPVSYTQRKYLKKGKKGKPGTVTMMREEVVFVEPGLPDDQIANPK